MKPLAHWMFAALLIAAGLLSAAAECSMTPDTGSAAMACCREGVMHCEMGTGHSSCCGDRVHAGVASDALATSVAHLNFPYQFQPVVLPTFRIEATHIHSSWTPQLDPSPPPREFSLRI